jgi:hypothetical protein
MSRPSATQVEKAKRLLASEGAPWSSSEECAAAAWRVYEKLNARLAPLLGLAGVQALFARSAKLAQAEFPTLAEMATPEGLTRLGPSLRALAPPVAAEATAMLFGTFLELMTTFIGDRLTVLVLRSAWPEIEETATGQTSETRETRETNK